MKILMQLAPLRPSGAEIMFALAAPLWRAMGHDLHILSVGAELGPYADTLANEGFTIHRIDTSHCGRLGTITTFSRMLRDIQPEVVHLHTEKLSMAFSLAARGMGFPTCRTLHSSYPFTGPLGARKVIERWIMRSAGCIQIAIGKSVLENERRRFGNPTRLIWNWFDDSKFTPVSEEERFNARRSLGIPDHTFAMVSIGNAADVKNYSLLIEAMAVRKPTSLTYYQVGAPHPNEVEHHLAVQLGVSQQFRPMGPTHEVRKWLSACDLFVMPSLREGFGLAAVEALACGVRCIFTETMGLVDFRDFAIDARWLPFDKRLWADTIEQTMSGAWGNFNGNENSRIVREAFGLTQGAENYAALWHECMKK